MKSPGKRPPVRLSVDNLKDTVKSGTENRSLVRSSTFPAVRPKADSTNAKQAKTTSPRETEDTDAARGKRRFTVPTLERDGNRTMPKISPRRHTLVNNFVEKDSNHTKLTPRGKPRPTPRQSSLLSRTKSLKSEVSNGQAESGGDTSSENSDGATNEQGQSTPRPFTPWEVFQEQIKTIDDSSLILCFKQESVNFRSSETFRETMGVLGIRNVPETTETQPSSVPAFGVRFSKLARFAVDRKNSVIKDDKQLALKAAARRGWNKIRRTIQEAQMQRKNSEASMGWRFLQATLRNMTDMERARQDLYKRYLFKQPESEIKRVPPRLLSAEFNKTYTSLVKQRQNASGSSFSSTPRVRSAMPQRPKLAKRQSVAELFSDRASIE